MTEPGAALAGALALADKICANAPLAVWAALATANREVSGDETAGWARSHAAHERLLATDDVKEGISAFFEAGQRTGRDTNPATGA